MGYPKATAQKLGFNASLLGAFGSLSLLASPVIAENITYREVEINNETDRPVNGLDLLSKRFDVGKTLYSFQIDGVNSGNIATTGPSAISIVDHGLFFQYPYLLQLISYSNTAAISTAGLLGLPQPTVSLNSVGLIGDDGHSHRFRSGSAGAEGGSGGAIQFVNSGAITATSTASQNASAEFSPIGIYAQSVGGEGGEGGSTHSVDHAGRGGAGGAGGSITIINQQLGTITTNGDGGHAIYAESVGGNGGNAGSAHGAASGNDGGLGGVGGGVSVTNQGRISTSGAQSFGIAAISMGGNGGGGSSSGFLRRHGNGDGGDGYSGGAVVVDNSGSITTTAEASLGIYALSLGGGGGAGASASGLFAALGGSGGDGGNAGGATVKQSGTVVTLADRSTGVHVQSIGGGGGRGGDAKSVGIAASVAIGGSGGGGGNGGAVHATLSGAITTTGRDAAGVMAQSIGGGGGSAGDARAASFGPVGSASVSLGGTGGEGGDGGPVMVTVQATGSITTGTAQQIAVQAPAGFAPTSDIPPVLTVNGANSYGVLAQSVGGGGGQGGRAASYAFAGSAETPAAAVTLSMGGSGGVAGHANTVQVTNFGMIKTHAARSDGIVAQSIGGGGGSGGNALGVAAAAAPTAITANVALGGKAGGGGHGGAVMFTNSGSIATLSGQSSGIVAQSIGGGGGNGGSVMSVEASLGKNAVAAGVDLGGSGGAGGNGGAVEVTNTGSIITFGQQSFGVIAQSVGGGGGNGGAVHDYSVSIATGDTAAKAGGKDLNATVNIGGKGGSGGAASQVNLSLAGPIATVGDLSHGVVVQSIGGGGGSGGSVFSLSVAAALSQSSQGGGTPGAQQLSASVAIGGNGGSGNVGGAVTVVANAGASITTLGDHAYGVLAQSVGGGGGNGGDAKSLSVATIIPTNSSDAANEAKKSFLGNAFGYLTGAFAKPADSMGVTGKSLSMTADVGGKGGAGNVGGLVNVILDPTANIKTYGSQSFGVFAQSVGGGGGNGGAANTDSLSLVKTYTASATVGGDAGSGNKGGAVIVTDVINGVATGGVLTYGHGASAIFAQSVGGGGGFAGVATDKTTSIPLISSRSLAITVGGKGGDGNDGGLASVTYGGAIETWGQNAQGILAQSIGGGGGVGHLVGAADLSSLLSFTMGGKGGSNGGGGGSVIVGGSGSITTHGALGYGILAQSIGGGGGTIDLSNSSGVDAPGVGVGAGGVPAVAPPKVTISFGNSSGPSQGDGGAVTVLRQGAIITSGNHAYGIFAQSVSGGGGVLGVAKTDFATDSGTTFDFYAQKNGTGGAVTVSDATLAAGSLTIKTSGIAAHAIFAQSIGGGGGLAVLDSNTTAPTITRHDATNSAGAAGGDITISSVGVLQTSGDFANGIFAHSGSGGAIIVETNQGYAESHGVRPSTSGKINITETGVISTTGANAHGILALGESATANAFNVTIGGAAPTTKITTAGAGSSALMIRNGDTNSQQVPVDQRRNTINVQINSGAILDLRKNNNQASAIAIENAVGMTSLGIGGTVFSGSADGLDLTRPAVMFKSAGSIGIQSSGAVTGAIVGNGVNSAEGAALTIAGSLRGAVNGISVYALSAGGTHFMPVDFQPGGTVADVGTVNRFSGVIRPFLTKFGFVHTGAGQGYKLIQAQLPFDTNLTAVKNSLVTTYEVERIGGVVVDSEESFVGSFGRKRIEYTGIGLKGVTVSFAKAPVDGNLSAVARKADSIVAQWTGSAQTPARLVTPLENDLYTALLAAANTSDIVDVNKTLRALQPTEQANTVVASSQAAVNHMSAMLSCGVAEGNFASIREGECAWASPTGSIVRNFEDRATYRDFGFVIGKQSALNDRWRAGVGVGYDYTTTRSPDVIRQGYRLHVGGALKYSSGPWLAALAVSAAYDWGDAARRIDLPTGLRTARSDRSAGVLASRLRLARLFEFGGIDLTPRVDFDATFIHDFGYSERDAGIWSVKTQASNSVLFDVHPALRLSSDFALGDANIVRPYLESGLRLNTTFGKSSVSFNPDTILAGATTVDHKRERRVATFGGGLSIFHDNRYELKMTYTGSFSRNSSGHTGMFKFASQF